MNHGVCAFRCNCYCCCCCWRSCTSATLHNACADLSCVYARVLCLVQPVCVCMRALRSVHGVLGYQYVDVLGVDTPKKTTQEGSQTDRHQTHGMGFTASKACDAAPPTTLGLYKTTM